MFFFIFYKRFSTVSFKKITSSFINIIFMCTVQSMHRLSQARTQKPLFPSNRSDQQLSRDPSFSFHEILQKWHVKSHDFCRGLKTFHLHIPFALHIRAVIQTFCMEQIIKTREIISIFCKLHSPSFFHDVFSEKIVSSKIQILR